MIRHITSSVLDRKYLALRSVDTAPITVDLSKMVVKKPWGYEHLLTSTPLVEIWYLSIDKNRSTSTHCHPNKKTALIVLSGKALFSRLNGSSELGPLDTIIIDSGVFHSTQAISKNGLKLIEVETPPMKSDLIRLEDKYGRVNIGYEGSEKMKLVNTSYVRFEDHSNCNIKNIGNCNINISFLEHKEDMNKRILKTSDIGVLLSGFIKSNTGKIIYKIGDVILFKELRKNKLDFQNVSLLSISRKK